MTENLLREGWTEPDSTELRILLNKHVGGSGPVDPEKNPNALYLPRAGSSCRVVLQYSGKEIARIEPGEGLDATEWDRISDEIDTSLLYAISDTMPKWWWLSWFRGWSSGTGALSGSTPVILSLINGSLCRRSTSLSF